jgi:hypothetical protein
MPQLDLVTFLPQFIWFAVAVVTCHALFQYRILAPISKIFWARDIGEWKLTSEKERALPKSFAEGAVKKTPSYSVEPCATHLQDSFSWLRRFQDIRNTEDYLENLHKSVILSFVSKNCVKGYSDALLIVRGKAVVRSKAAVRGKAAKAHSKDMWAEVLRTKKKIKKNDKKGSFSIHVFKTTTM